MYPAGEQGGCRQRCPWDASLSNDKVCHQQPFRAEMCDLMVIPRQQQIAWSMFALTDAKPMVRDSVMTGDASKSFRGQA